MVKCKAYISLAKTQQVVKIYFVFSDAPSDNYSHYSQHMVARTNNVHVLLYQHWSTKIAFPLSKVHIFSSYILPKVGY